MSLYLPAKLNMGNSLNNNLIFCWMPGFSGCPFGKDLMGDDTIGLSYGGTCPTISGAAGFGKSAGMYFNGIQEIAIPNPAFNAKLGTVMSASVLVCVHSRTAGYAGFIHENNNGGLYPFGLRVNGTATYFSMYSYLNPSGGDIVGTTAYELDKVYHVAFTSDGITNRLYVDGVMENSGAKSAGNFSSSVDLEIGGWRVFQYGSAYTSANTIFSVRIYDRCLSGDEMRALAIQEKNGFQELFDFDEDVVGSVASPIVATPPTKAITLTPFAPAVRAPRLVTPDTRWLHTQAIAPSVATPLLATPPKIGIAVASMVPDVLTPRLVTPPTKTLQTTKYAPQIQFTITIPTKSLVISRSAPQIQLGVIPSTKALILSKFAPTIVTPRVIVPSTNALLLSKFTPQIVTPKTIVPEIASFLLNSFVPSARIPEAVTPPSLSLLLNAFPPSVGLSFEVVPQTCSLILQCFAPTVTTTGASELKDILAFQAELEVDYLGSSSGQFLSNQSASLEQNVVSGADFQQVVLVGSEGTFSVSFRAEL